MNPSEDPNINTAAAHAPLHTHQLHKTVAETNDTTYDASFKGTPKPKPAIHEVYSQEEIDAHNAKVDAKNADLAQDDPNRQERIKASDTDEDPDDSGENEDPEAHDSETQTEHNGVVGDGEPA